MKTIALRQLEEIPGVGTVSVALHVAVEELYQAHADVELLLVDVRAVSDSDKSTE
jgi:hypothetical protein